VLHVRVVTTPDRSLALVDRFAEHPAIVNIVHLPHASRCPDGDVVMFDVAREAANAVIGHLRDLEIDQHGSISLLRLTTSISAEAEAAEAHAAGDPSDAVIWEEVEARVREDSGLSISYLVFMVVATLIAAVGILTNSAILLVGAMVVGPEYGVVSGIALGIHNRHPDRTRRSLHALVLGFGISIVAAAALTGVLRIVDVIPSVYREEANLLTQFVARPDIFAVIVAILAGVAGTLALTEARGGTLTGVLISVTTIPAAADVGVGLAFWNGSEIFGALGQLLINLVCLVAAGVATLRIQSTYWKSAAVARRNRARGSARGR
jgi:uncharacterized hydrophobic protein (TIGR00271 family)